MAWGTVISWPYQGVSVRAWSSSTRAARSTSWNRGAPGVSSSSCRRGDGSWGRGSCSVGAPLPAASPPWPCAAPECCRAPRCTPAPAPPPRAQQHGLRSARRVHDAQAGVHQRRLRRQIAPPGPVPAPAWPGTPAYASHSPAGIDLSRDPAHKSIPPKTQKSVPSCSRKGTPLFRLSICAAGALFPCGHKRNFLGPLPKNRTKVTIVMNAGL